MSVIERIERGELNVLLVDNGYNIISKPGEELSHELMHLAKLGEKMRWIPVTPETMPKHGQLVDIWVVDADGDGERNSGDVEYDDENKLFRDHWGEEYDLLDDEAESKVTHWTPLPEPPKEEG